MNRIQILDCTLRDGGYCNQWMFGYENIKVILDSLVRANIDIVECGFLSEEIKYIEDRTKFSSVEQAEKVLPVECSGKMFVAMINYGEYEVNKIPLYQKGRLEGFRIAFHKKDVIVALKMCEQIQAKGYKVFIQAMVSLSYTDEEFISLIRQVNVIQPYAFYIVDSFGTMKGDELTRLFYIVEHNLKEDIIIGFHSHNNMQLAYSNAQKLVEIPTNRKLIIDSSVYGMGRGAGNLNTELFVEYLNDNTNANYKLNPLLSVIDNILIRFHEEHYWGYTLPNYLSARHNAHPNYATYLASKQTLNVENMDEIFSMMDSDKKLNFDKFYIEQLYGTYMEREEVEEERLRVFSAKLDNMPVLLLAPGRSILEEEDRIWDYYNRKKPIVISINFFYSNFIIDYVFSSNPRRFRDLDKAIYNKCIVTSNILSKEVYLKIKYRKLLNNNEVVNNNAGMMVIKFLIDLGVKEIGIAGMDGYSVDAFKNYADEKMMFYTERAVCDDRNKNMSSMLTEYAKECEISFVTKPRYIILGKKKED